MTPADRRTLVEVARARAELLYAGEKVPHRSCGIALAETFGLPTRSYQALRRGGLTGEGPCGAIAAGVLVLGEILGDPDPTAPAPPALLAAVPYFRAVLAKEVAGPLDSPCNARVAPLGDFLGTPRKAMCTALAGRVAAAVADALCEVGHPPDASLKEAPP